MNYFLIAGEASGDLHASNLMREISRLDPDAQFRCMGGDLMEKAGGDLIMHYRETSYMMLDVLFHLRKILRNMRRLKRAIRQWQPDVLIPVDYPAFNLRIAKFATGLDIPVFYYISPKVWAWKQKRTELLRKYTRELFVILPFEVDFFRKLNMEVHYFGNPLVDSVFRFRKEFTGKRAWKKSHGLDDRPVAALLAGSRKKEIEAMLPVMKEIASGHPELQFVVAGAPSIEKELYDRYLEDSPIRLVRDETYALLETAEVGMVTSGTATLEAALFQVPQVVLYRTGWLAYSIAKRFIKINFISLVNLIGGKGIVAEVIQKEMTRLAGGEFSRIVEEPKHREQMLGDYSELEQQLGEPGVSERIARKMVELLR